MKRADVVQTILPYIREIRGEGTAFHLEVITIEGEPATEAGEYVLISDEDTLISCHEAALSKYAGGYLRQGTFPDDRHVMAAFAGAVLHPVMMSGLFLEHARKQLQKGNCLLMNKVGGTISVKDPQIIKRKGTTVADFFS